MTDQPDSQPQTVVNVNMANTNTATAEARAEAEATAGPPVARPLPAVPPLPENKSALGAYLRLVFLPFIAAHRSYLGRPPLVWLAGVYLHTALAAALEIPLLFAGAAVLVAVDLFEIPGWVRDYNKSVRMLVGTAKAKKKAREDLRTLLLQEAHRGDGKLTVTQGVMATRTDWERVEGCLRDMVQAGYVDVDNEPHSGVIVYVFPELAGRPGALADPERA